MNVFFAFYTMFLFVSNNRDVMGMVTMTNLTAKMLNGAVKSSDSVTNVLYKQFEMVHTSAFFFEAGSKVLQPHLREVIILYYLLWNWL